MKTTVAADTALDRELERLGFFVTPECPVLSRSLDAGGYALLVHLPEALPLPVLSRLAECKNRDRLIERVLAVPACSPPEIEVTPEMIRVGIDAYADFDSRFEGEDAAVRRIFLAMMVEYKRRISS